MSMPASAGFTYATDGDGVDYDAACVAAVPTSPPGPNSIGSPGAGCNGTSIYDGSTEATDLVDTISTNSCFGMTTSPPTTWALCLASATLPPPASDVKKMFAGWNIDATTVPPPGDTTAPDGTLGSLDTPHSSFGGAQYFSMFQNTVVQTNEATNGRTPPLNSPGGCTRVGTGTPVFDQYESWKDGFHFWESYGIHWDGNRWVHSIKVGEYDPSPSGGFFFFEVAYNEGNGWVNSNFYMTKGIHWDVNVTADASGTQIVLWIDGVFRTPDTTNCQEGFFKHRYAAEGDRIINAKALTTADQVFVLPVAIPLSDLCGPSMGLICEDDLKSIGGFVFFSDVTSGNSTAGLFTSNISGIAYTGGAIGVSDTLGQGHTCPTPTFGGQVPKNPTFTKDTACHIDDDGVARGSFLSEWWDTVEGFTF